MVCVYCFLNTFWWSAWGRCRVSYVTGESYWYWLTVWQGLLLVALWFILRGDLLYVFPCVILFVCFLVLLVLRLPRLGKRELILVLFVRLFGLCLFRFVGFLFLLGSGKGCGLWLWHSLDFLLLFFAILIAGKGEGNVFISSFFYFFPFIPVPLSSLALSFISSTISSISYLPFSGRRHKMTHRGWRFVKHQHNQKLLNTWLPTVVYILWMKLFLDIFCTMFPQVIVLEYCKHLE